jgi:hypothetical protein
MQELAILFIHHSTDVVTTRHYSLLKESNPSAVVVPIGCGNSSHLPGSFVLKDAVNDPFETASFIPNHRTKWDNLLAIPIAKNGIWYNLDTVVCTWFLNRQVSAKRYIILEWDCLCTEDLSLVYKSYWNCPIAAAEHFTRTSKANWFWFTHFRGSWAKMGEIEGIAPMAGILLSSTTFEQLVDFYKTNWPRIKEVFSEIRLGTALKQLGIAPATITLNGQFKLSPSSVRKYPTERGLYHAVKFSPEYYKTKVAVTNLVDQWRKLPWKILHEKKSQ